MHHACILKVFTAALKDCSRFREGDRNQKIFSLSNVFIAAILRFLVVHITLV